MCAGNTCFLNSILQVLYYTPTFVDNVNILHEEMKATIIDYDRIRTVTVSKHRMANSVSIICLILGSRWNRRSSVNDLCLGIWQRLKKGRSQTSGHVNFHSVTLLFG